MGKWDTYDQIAHNIEDDPNLHCLYNVTTTTTISIHLELAGSHHTKDPEGLSKETTIIRGETITNIGINKVEADKDHRDRTMIKIGVTTNTRDKILTSNKPKIKC